MKYVVSLILALAMTGCASLNNAGTADYSVEPIFDQAGNSHCCKVSIRNGKEIGVLDVSAEKTGDSYKVSLHEEGVKAFEGQNIAAGAAKTAAADAVKAAAMGGAVLAAPALASVAGAAMATGTAGAAAAGAAGAMAVDKLTQPTQP